MWTHVKPCYSHYSAASLFEGTLGNLESRTRLQKPKTTLTRIIVLLVISVENGTDHGKHFVLLKGSEEGLRRLFSRMTAAAGASDDDDDDDLNARWDHVLGPRKDNS